MNISLGDGVKMDLDKLVESRLLVQANSGGGKSWAIRRVIEQSFGKKQIIVLDPEGEFGNLRTKYDFVYVGRGGDAPAESRSAALLAHRLLELKASAIIDLYELPPQERKHFVRLFCEALVNAPKELWHDALIIIDEAHVFAPEKDQSESLSAIIDLASRGRKRGYCAVLATQRPAKLNKDAAAECNNKFIGRASLDIDRKRASEELGFSTKESVLSLRDLEPGEFYVFGPAISRDVVKVRMGDVSVKPAKRGVSRGTVPAPSATVRAILSKLADIPQEAQKQAETVTELKTQLAAASRELARLGRVSVPAEPSKELQERWYDLGFAAAKQVYEPEARKLRAILEKVAKISGEFFITIEQGPVKLEVQVPRETVVKKVAPGVELRPALDQNRVGKGEIECLKSMAAYPDGVTRVQLTILTGYKRSTRDAYIQRLVQRGYATLAGDRVRSTETGIEALGSDYQPVPTDPRALYEHYCRTLPSGEVSVLQAVYDYYPNSLNREVLSDMTEFKRSTRDAYIQRLVARQLIEITREGVRISNHLR